MDVMTLILGLHFQGICCHGNIELDLLSKDNCPLTHCS